MHDFDRNSGIIFYSQVGRNGLSCWNTAKPYLPENHVLLAQNNQTMIYPGDLNVKNFFFVKSFSVFIFK